MIYIKESIHQEDIIIVNIYAPNIGAPKIYKANIVTNPHREIDSNTIIAEDFKTHFQQRLDNPDRKINNETVYLNYTLDQMDLIKHI